MLLQVQILRVLIPEGALHEGQPVYEVLVQTARKQGLATAVVYRSCTGFGAQALLQSAGLLALSPQQTLIVEIMDLAERIQAFVPQVRALVSQGAIFVHEGQGCFALPVPIKEIMTHTLATVNLETPLAEVVNLLLGREIKAVPVMSKNKIAGIITGGDLLSRAKMPLRLGIHEHLSPPWPSKGHGLEFGTLVAQDIMTSPVKTLNVQATIQEALLAMATHKVKRLPILNAEANVVGIVSRTDILESIGKVAAVAGRLRVLPPGIKSTAQDILYPHVPTSSPEEPIASIAAKLAGSFLRLVVVLDDQQKILGIIHDWYVLQEVAATNPPAVVARLVAALTQRDQADFLPGVAQDFMRDPQVMAGPEATVAELIQLLTTQKMKRIIIADSNNKLLGVVDRDMILQKLASSVQNS